MLARHRAILKLMHLAKALHAELELLRADIEALSLKKQQKEIKNLKSQLEEVRAHATS